MNNFDKAKFKLSETFNNENGKTSGSGFIGIILGLTTSIAFIAGIFGWFLEMELVIEYFGKVLQLGGLSIVLLGARKGVEYHKKRNDKI